MSDLPPLPEFARGDWTEISNMIAFSPDGAFGKPGTLGPHEIGYTRETFIRGAALMLYGDKADEVVEHWRKLNAGSAEGPR